MVDTGFETLCAVCTSQIGGPRCEFARETNSIFKSDTEAGYRDTAWIVEVYGVLSDLQSLRVR